VNPRYIAVRPILQKFLTVGHFAQVIGFYGAIGATHTDPSGDTF
jgi:hypothetical protein